jgi:VanZ family protein
MRIGERVGVRRGDTAGPDAGAWLHAWGPALLWMSLIFFLSSRSTLPGPDDPLWNTLLKKAGHFLVYAVLARLYLRALEGTTGTLPRGAWIAWGLAALYALSDEVHQGFVPGRHPAIIDGLIDGAGAATALLIRQPVRESDPAGSAPQ